MSSDANDFVGKMIFLGGNLLFDKCLTPQRFLRMPGISCCHQKLATMPNTVISTIGVNTMFFHTDSTNCIRQHQQQMQSIVSTLTMRRNQVRFLQTLSIAKTIQRNRSELCNRYANSSTEFHQIRNQTIAPINRHNRRRSIINYWIE